MNQAVSRHTLPTLSAIQRNHALEHASIHVLSKRHPGYRFLGRSDFNGFYLFTRLPMEETADGIQSALQRLQAGEARLAVHPNCGTNLLTGAFLAAFSGMLVFSAPRKEKSWSDQLDLLPTAVMTSMLSLMAAQPLGSLIQKSITTRSDLDRTRILSISSRASGRNYLYRILTQH